MSKVISSIQVKIWMQNLSNGVLLDLDWPKNCFRGIEPIWIIQPSETIQLLQGFQSICKGKVDSRICLSGRMSILARSQNYAILMVMYMLLWLWYGAWGSTYDQRSMTESQGQFVWESIVCLHSSQSLQGPCYGWSYEAMVYCRQCVTYIIHYQSNSFVLTSPNIILLKHNMIIIYTIQWTR